MTSPTDSAESAEPLNKVVIKYMTNGNKAKLLTSGLLNTAALSTNASLLALIIQLEKINATASISLCLILLSVALQLMTAILTLLEFRATLIIDRDPEKILQARTRTLKVRRDGRNGNNNPGSETDSAKETKELSTYLFCKPLELQFTVAVCTVFLTAVNTFVIALTSNIRENIEVPAGYIPAGTINYQNSA